jgi:hypothetical protein
MYSATQPGTHQRERICRILENQIARVCFVHIIDAEIIFIIASPRARL